jgi:hypothetical protein
MMKKKQTKNGFGITCLSVICLVTLFLTSGCNPVSPEEYQALTNENAAIGAELAEEQQKVLELRGQLETESARLAEIQSDNQRRIDELTANLTALQAEYERRLANVTGASTSELRNPTWLELKEFLESDHTDLLVYEEDSFDCSGFAITLRDRAWRYGLRCAYIEITHVDSTTGHALNAFKTSDEGIIYVDVINDDMIAYVQIGQPYGKVPLDGVKTKFISCEGNPDNFWNPLTWETYPHIFVYDYYSKYQQRTGFYQDTIDAYNEAADNYNRGVRKYTPDQLTLWLENIDALEKDLGVKTYEPGDRVATIEVYWN